MAMLVELHSIQVVIKKTDGASSEVYGRVTAEDFLGLYDIYRAEKENSNPITTDGILPLTGPPRCILSPRCAFTVSLKERLLDLEVANGYLYVNHDPCMDYNRPLSAIINGDHGYSVLHFSLIEGAVHATIEVSLVAEIEKLPYAVHGEILADYSTYDYDNDYTGKYHRTVLLKIPSEQAIELGRAMQDVDSREVEHSLKEINIPLSRCVVAVPPRSLLGIRANLWINMEIGSQETSTQVVNDIAYFATGSKFSGPTVQTFQGSYGRIAIKVNWINTVATDYLENIAIEE